MPTIVGLVVRQAPADSIPGRYLKALEDALDAHKLTHKTKLGSGDFTGPDRDVHIRVLGASGNPANYPTIAKDLLTEGATIVLVADAAATTPMRDARVAGKSLKVVSGMSFHPVEFGHVSATSYPVPDKNVTGVLVGTPTLNYDRLKLLKDVAVPTAASLTVDIVVASGDPCGLQEAGELVTAAATLGIKITSSSPILIPHKVSPSVAGLKDNYFQPAVDAGTDAFIVIRSPFFQDHRDRVATAINQVGRPAMYPFADYVEEGGLISHGPDRVAGMKRAGDYVARLVKGEAIAKLPFLNPDPADILTGISEGRWKAQSAHLNAAGKPKAYVKYP